MIDHTDGRTTGKRIFGQNVRRCLGTAYVGVVRDFVGIDPARTQSCRWTRMSDNAFNKRWRS
jgi:hypothetical protein